jgi:hypothetical protein
VSQRFNWVKPPSDLKGGPNFTLRLFKGKALDYAFGLLEDFERGPGIISWCLRDITGYNPGWLEGRARFHPWIIWREGAKFCLRITWWFGERAGYNHLVSQGYDRFNLGAKERV